MPTDPLSLLRSRSRLALAHLPTRIERMPRVEAALGLERLWVKRDDCTGLGLGGNKVRKLEFEAKSQAEYQKNDQVRHHGGMMQRCGVKTR